MWGVGLASVGWGGSGELVWSCWSCRPVPGDWRLHDCCAEPSPNDCACVCMCACVCLLAAAWQEYKQRKRLGGQREKETLSRLARFRQDLQQAAVHPPRAVEQQQLEAAGAGPAAATGAGAGVEQQQQPDDSAAAAGGAGADGGGYSGKVRDDIDHKAYMPGARCAVLRPLAPRMPCARAHPATHPQPAPACLPTFARPPALIRTPAPTPAAAWRVDDYLAEGGDGEDDAIDLASLRQHRLAFAKGQKDAMARRWEIAGWRAVADEEPPLAGAAVLPLLRAPRRCKPPGPAPDASPSLLPPRHQS